MGAFLEAELSDHLGKGELLEVPSPYGQRGSSYEHRAAALRLLVLPIVGE
jgi:hypothetical protein